MAVITTPKEIRPSDRIIYIDDYPVIRAQRIGLAPNFNTTELTEIGSDGIVESVADVITTQVTLETNSIGSINVMQKLMGEYAAYPRLAATPTNSGIITQADFEVAITDVAVAVKEGTALRRTIYIPNCYLTAFDYTYNVDGVSTENYTMLGDVDYDAVGDYRDLRVYRGFYWTVSGFTVSGYALGGAAYDPVQASVNGIVVATGANIVLTTSGSDTTVNMSTYSSLAQGDRCRLIASKATPDTWATKISAAGLATPGYGGIFGRQVKVYLAGSGVTATDTDKMLRVQSCSINGDLSREEMKELGNARIVNKRLNTPLRLNCSVDVAENDLEAYAKMIGGATWTSFSGYKYNDGTDGILMSTADLGRSSKLIVNIYKERTDTPTTILKQIVMSGLYMTSKSRDASSTARGTVSFGFQGSFITISGSAVNPLA